MAPLILHPEGVPNGDPYPVLICLPDGTPLMAVADLSPDYDPFEIAQLICDRFNQHERTEPHERC